jgi:predicted negative regulator of RcsB-dependent stress response
MRYKYLVPILLFALLAVALPAAAQSWAGQGRVQGEVRDEQGKPVEGATITLRKGTEKVEATKDGPKQIVTDKRGKWAILGLAGGAWRILIEKDGFMPSEGQIKVYESGSPPPPLVVTLKVPPKEVQQAAKEPSKNALAKTALQQANADLEAKRFAEARANFEKGLGLLENPEPVLKLSIERSIANTYYQEKQPDKAIEVLKKSLETAPNDPETLQLLVNLLVAQNKEEEAKVYMAKLPQGTKIDPVARLNIGIKAYNERKLDEALKQFDQVVQENPSLGDAYYYRGLVYLNMNKNKEAKADFQKLLEIDPKSQYANDAREFLKSL